MKKFLYFLLFMMFLSLIYAKRNVITKEIMVKYVDDNLKFEEPNNYYKPYDYEYIKNTDSLYPKTRQDILNILYTTLNRGQTEISFYCEYDECISDVNEIAGDVDILSSINNFVHPFNSFRNIYFTINNYGKIEIKVKKQYSDSEILLINNKIDTIISELSLEGLSGYDMINSFHDYIINNTKYDSTVSIESQILSDTNANKATGLLFENKAVCSGYSDTMAIFLNKLGYNNYRISSLKHIWNLIYIDGSWKHIDTTWDDPISNDGSDILLHDFFMIDTNQLFEKEKQLQQNDHNFNVDIYKEAI